MVQSLDETQENVSQTRARDAADIVPASHHLEDCHVQGAGPPLIYVPGLDGTGLLFYRQARLLARRFRVITFRLRDEARDMDTLVAEIARHLDVAVPDGTPAIVVGESFGGALAMHFALSHPERVRALVVLNSFTRITPKIKLYAAIAATSIVPWGAMGIVRRFTGARLQSSHTHRDEIRRFLLLTRAITREGYTNRLRILTRYDLRERLKDIRVPTLFLAADEDHLIPSVEQATYMAARVPGAIVRILKGHGHGCFLAPDLDLDVILQEWGGR